MKKLHKIKSVVCAICAFLGAVGTLSAEKLPISSFGKVMDVTLSGYAGTTTLADFPVLVRIPAAYTDDFAFASTTKEALAYELDSTLASGDQLVWVKVPEVKPVAEGATKVKVYLGVKSGATRPANEPTAVWSDYAGVWHMNEAADAQTDRTGNGLTANLSSGITRVGDDGIVEGPVGTALYKSGGMTAADFFAADQSYTTDYQSYSVSGWYYWPDYTGSNNQNPLQKGGWNVHSWYCQHRTNGTGQPKTHLAIIYYSTPYDAPENSTLDCSLNWNFITFSYDGTTASVYVNGLLVHTVNRSLDKGSAVFTIGSPKGQCDETRVRRAPVSADWAAADFQQVSRAVETPFCSYGSIVDNDGLQIVAIPAVSSEPIDWDGQVHRPDIAERAGMAIDWGEDDFRSVGVHTVTCTISDPTQYKWEDDTQAAKEFQVTIAPLARPIAVTVKYDAGFIHSLSFPASSEGATLYRLRGTTDQGTVSNLWDSVELVGGVSAGQTTVDVPAPADFTSGCIRYVLAEGVYPEKQYECVYINGAWFDTGVYAVAGSTRTEIDFQFVDEVRKQDRLLEARTSGWTSMPSTNLHYEVYVNGGGNGACVCRKGSDNSSNGTVGAANKNRVTCVLDAYEKFFTWYGSGKVTSNFNQTDGARSETTIAVPLCPNTGSAGARGNLFGVKIYEKGVPVRDFVPARVNGTDGLYERLTGTFAASENATAFVGGTEVAVSVQPGCPYVAIGVSEVVTVQTAPIVSSSITAVDSSSMTVAWTLSQTGAGAATAAVKLRYGTSPDVLDAEVTLAEAAAAGANGSYRIEGLVQGQTYYLRVVADNGTETSDSPILSETVKMSIELVSAVAQANGAMRFAWRLHAVGEGAATADIRLAWGYAADSLAYTQTVATAAAVGADGTFDTIMVAGGADFYARLVATDNLGGVGTSATAALTMPDRTVDAVGALRGTRVTGTTVEAGRLAAVDLAFDAGTTGTNLDLYVATAAVPGEKDLSKWSYEKIGTVTDATTAWHFTDIPSDWGTEKFAMRFFLASDVGSLRYGRDGLFAQLDGIDSAGYGVHGDWEKVSEHAWVDLVSGLSFASTGANTLYTSNAVQTATDNIASGNYLSCFDPRPLSCVLAKSFTIELAIHTYGYRQYAGIFALGCEDGGGSHRILCVEHDGSGSSASTMYALQYLTSSFKSDAMTELGAMTYTNVTMAVTVDADGAHLFLDGVLVHTSTPNGLSSFVNDIYLGRYTQNSAKTDFHSVRFYSRALAADELAANAAIDRIRFFGAEDPEPVAAVEWSPTVYWTDPNLVAFDSAAVDVSTGDTATYSGRVHLPDGVAAGDVTLTLYAGAEPDPDDRTATVLGTPAADGTFSFATAVEPGATFYWTLKAEPSAGLSALTARDAAVTVPSASAIASVATVTDNLQITAVVKLSEVGVGTSYAKLCWAGSDKEYDRETEFVEFVDGIATIVIKMPADGTCYYKAVVSNGCGSAFWTTESARQAQSVTDAAVYTWKAGLESGVWESAESWTASSATGVGYPTGIAAGSGGIASGAASRAFFPAGTTATVSFVSTANFDCGLIDCSADDLNLVFTGTRKSPQIYATWFALTGKRGEIALRDLSLYVRNLTDVSYLDRSVSCAPGEGRTLRLDNADLEQLNEGAIVVMSPDAHIIVENGSYLYTWSYVNLGGDARSTFEIDDSKVSVVQHSGYGLWMGYGGNSFGSMIFRGAAPRLEVSGQFRHVKASPGDGHLVFVLPEGGYTNAPVALYNIQGKGTTTAKFAADTDPAAVVPSLELQIDPSSPGLTAREGFVTTLVDWSSGIDTNRVTLTSAGSRARNGFVVAETDPVTIDFEHKKNPGLAIIVR